MTENDPAASIPTESSFGQELHGLDPGELLARGINTVRPSGGGGSWVPPTPGELARMLPQYHIESLLGHGGMGAVYKGSQPDLDRPVAIKLLPAELSDDEFVGRFKREARTLAKLHHHSIVSVYDFGQTSEGYLYFVMEYVDGTDLRRALQTSRLEPDQALELICQICEALQVAHKMGVIHRDIKPANILLTSDGTVKLADFGLARPLQATDSGALTMTNMTMGTADYMSPEQRAGSSDQRTDIYALGITLYEMLTGKCPQGAFLPPSKKVPMDARIDEVVHKALQEEPDHRYQQVSEMKSAVDRIRTTLPVAAQPAVAPPPGNKKKSASPKALAFVASACVVLLAGAGFLIFQNGSRQVPGNSQTSNAEKTPSPPANPPTGEMPLEKQAAPVAPQTTAKAEKAVVADTDSDTKITQDDIGLSNDPNAAQPPAGPQTSNAGKTVPPLPPASPPTGGVAPPEEQAAPVAPQPIVEAETSAANPAPSPEAMPATPQDMMAWVLEKKENWPKEVKLTQAVLFPALVNGKAAGTVSAPAGAVVTVTDIQRTQMSVVWMKTPKSVPVDATDLMTRLPAEMARRAGGKTSAAKPAAVGKAQQTSATPQTTAKAEKTAAAVAAGQNESGSRATASSVIVTTLAGRAGYPGTNDGKGSAARFNKPSGVAVDTSGNVYVGDTASGGNAAVRKITPSGVVTTLAGSEKGGAADGHGNKALFFTPESLAVDSSGNLFVTDTRNYTIRKITPGGDVTTLAGSAGETGNRDGHGRAARFTWPRGVAVDSSGNLFVADTQNSTIRKITPGRIVTTLAGGAGEKGNINGPGNTARFFQPIGVAADSEGNLFVADSGNSAIRKITPEGVVTTFFSGKNPCAVAVDTCGNIYVLASNGILKIMPDGEVATLVETGNEIGSSDGIGREARFNGPRGLAVDASGNIYVADTANYTIRKITPAEAKTSPEK